uniref:Uncharacterized protein n=1 Tax=Nicotiana tabacum TaxID=4097 RepID=A0A1S4DG92_TOBAC
MVCETTKGEITLLVNTAGTIQKIKFYVIEGDIRYNAKLRRPWVHNMREVPSTLHHALKFPMPGGIKTVYGEQPVTKKMFTVDEEEWGVDEEGDYGVPRSFIARDDTDDTKSTIEELEQVISIEHLPDRK